MKNEKHQFLFPRTGVPRRPLRRAVQRTVRHLPLRRALTALGGRGHTRLLFYACAWAVVFITISAGFRDTEPYGFSGAKNTRSLGPPKNPENPLDFTLKI